MAARIVPSLQEILYRLAGAASREAAQMPTSNNPGRFPVVVRPETRAFLEAQASYLGGSIAGVAGAILDGVAMASQASESSVGALRAVAERFNLLVQEHELSFPAAVEALADLGFSLADLASSDALQLKLSSPVLRAVSERFYVNYEWLAGRSEHIVAAPDPCWYKAAEEAARKLLDAKTTCTSAELLLLIKPGTDLESTDDDQDWKHAPYVMPVLSRTKLLPGGEELTTYEVWEEGRWSYWRCRDYMKLAIYFAYRLGLYPRGRTIDANDYSMLRQGQVLPATVLHRNSPVTTWHPDDYVLTDSAVAKATDEWIKIEDNYARELEYFAELSAAKEESR